MRKGLKKVFIAATAAVMAVSALSLGACGYKLPPIKDVPAAAATVDSNGGFIVKKGDYLYFINGVEPSTSSNKYGTPLRGALMRVKESDVKAGKNNPEMVIPSLMVGDTGAGIYIYNDGKDDRIYYATPNTARDTESNTVDSSYIDFKSAKLDGTSIKSHFRLSSDSTTYRIVKEGNDVYVLYIEGSNLYSYNLNTNKSTTLVEGGSGYTLGGTDKMPEYVYYTMNVVKNADSDKGNITYNYNQIYRVKASATEAPYEYKFDEDYIKDELGGAHPYVNLGELVLDGRGKTDGETQFNHQTDTDPLTTFGYKYTLRSRQNDGIYFTREEITNTESVGLGANLYYVAEDDIGEAEEWSLTGNGELDTVASSTNTDKATTSALYYIDDDGNHHYLYVESGSIYRADVETDENKGGVKGEPLEIAHSLSSPVLRYIDSESDDDYGYVYYTTTSGSGVAVSRAVYTGDKSNYEDLQFGVEGSEGYTDNKDYKAASVLDIKHSSAWYPFEIIDDILYFADAATDVNSTAYGYVNAVSLKNEDDKLMNNRELAAFNEKYNELMDSKKGVFAKITEFSSDYNKLVNALRYYFFTGKTDAFYDNIDEAVKEYNKSDVYLYSEEEKAAFKAFVDGEEYISKKGEEFFTADIEKDARVRSAYVTFIGQMTDAHIEEQNEYWHNYLERYVPKTNTDDGEGAGLSAGAKAGIGIAVCVVLLAAAAVVAFLLIKKKKKGTEKPKEEKLHVDTTDDRSVNVYEDEPAETPAEEASTEEAPVEEVSVEEPATEEAPAEEPAVEATSEEPAEAPADEPAEAPAPEEPKTDSEE